MVAKKQVNDIEKLLNWLDSDAAKAGEKYERIRRVLIKIFLSNKCFNAEDLADITFDRVASKIDSIKENYSGDKSSYFAGVARKVVLENHRNKELYLNEEEFNRADNNASDFFESEKQIPSLEIKCLRKCLKTIKRKNRSVILAYFAPSNEKKTDLHKKIAEKYSISANALRIQIFRDKGKLANCYKKCLTIKQK
jgi:DNA-directed RNA polymerase specialized sigma24 family protein